MQSKFFSKKRTCLFLIIGIALLITIFLLSVCLGSVPISFKEMKQAFTESHQTAMSHFVIITTIRLPRILAAFICGASLAVSGVFMQAFFQNPIVEPYVLGISSGANLFVGLVMLGGFTFGLGRVSTVAMLIGSFLGAILVMLLVIFAAQKVKNVTTLLIIGLMFGYVCSAATNLLIAFADREKIASFTLWNMGSFSGFRWSDIGVVYLITVPFLLLAFFMAKPLNLLRLGEAYAVSSGVSIRKTRIAIVLISSVLIATVTAFAGPVSFIGLAVPHIVRMLFRTDNHRILLPAVCIYGAVMAGACDLIARQIVSPVELPLGVVTSMIGAPIVVYFLVRQRRNVL